MCIISIIIPVYNTEQYLDKCVYSVLESTFRDIEVLLVDDGSPDGNMCDKYPLEDNRVRVIRFANNRGLSAARNEGVNQAKAPYICFVDSDDWVHPFMFERLYFFLKEYNAQIASCGATEYIGSIARKKFVMPKKKEIVMDKLDALGRLLISDPAALHVAWGKIYDKKLFDNIRYPEGRIYEDAAVTYKLYYKADTVVHLPVGYYSYTIRNHSLSNKGFTQKSMDKLKAADEVLGFISEYTPDLIQQAICFRLVTAMRLAADFDAGARKKYQAQYNEINQILKEKIIPPMLSARHKFLLFVYRYCRPLYKALWDIRLRRRVA